LAPAAGFAAGFAAGLAAEGAGRSGRPASAGAPAGAAAVLDGAAAFEAFFSGTFAGRTGFAGPEDFTVPAFAEVERTAPFESAAGGGRLADAAFDGFFSRSAGLLALPEAAALLFGEGFPAAGFLGDDFPGLALILPAGFPDFEAGRLLPDPGLFGAFLRAAALPGFFPFTLGIRQPFRSPLK
jgi:hypothetical protein